MIKSDGPAGEVLKQSRLPSRAKDGGTVARNLKSRAGPC